VLFVAMIVFVILVTAHTMWWFAVPGLWLGLILIAAVALAGRSRR
jgi:hypothetical protein